MTLYEDNEISDYWSIKEITLEYPITRYLSRNRFQELYMRMKMHGEEAKGPYAKVSEYN
jgi:hypothetical protein